MTPGSAPGSDGEVVLQLLLVAVVHQVDAGVDVLVLDLAVVGDVGVPLAGIVADEVVAGAGERVQTNDLRLGIGPDELERNTTESAGPAPCRRRAQAACRLSTASVGVRNSA